MAEKNNFIISPASFYLLTFLVLLTFLLTLFNTYNSFLSGGITGLAVNDLQNQSQESNETSILNELIMPEAPMLGNKEANITIIEFSDYECPYCRRHFKQTYPQLLRDYIETGKASLIFRDFPLSSLHKNAEKAAEAAHCVREQLNNEGYFKMHDILFENQQNLSVENFRLWARSLNLIGEQFDNCLDSGKYAGFIEFSIREGISKGVLGTPTFFINERKIEGAQPYIIIKQILDSS